MNLTRLGPNITQLSRKRQRSVEDSEAGEMKPPTSGAGVSPRSCIELKMIQKAQCMKMGVEKAKPGNPSLIPGTHMVEGED